MFDKLSPSQRFLGFYALAFGMVVAVGVAPGASTALAMFTPLVATLLMLLVVTREGWTRTGWASLGLHRAAFRHWAAAVGVPITVVGVAHVLLWLSGAVGAGANEATRGAGFAMLPLVILGPIPFASLTVSLTEEIGWRGYMLPRMRHLGTRSALLLSGLLHGLWHLPVVFLTDLYLPDGSRWIIVPAFVLCVTAAGVFMGSLRLRSDSVWPAVLAHSAHNAAIAGFGAYTIGNPVVLEHIAGEAGALTVLGYIVVAVWLLRRTPRSGTAAVKRPGTRIDSTVEIDVPAERVWAVLTDFGRYPEWNPFVSSVTGELIEGGRLTVRLRPPGGRGMTFRPRLLTVDPGRELRWLGRLGIPGLFDGEHYFVIERLGDDRCRLTQGEEFRGVFVRFFGKGLEATAEGFAQMNLALKARAEQPAPAVA